MTRFRKLLLLVALAALVAGCSALTTIIHTQNALNDAGYGSAHVSSSFSGSVSTVKVSVSIDTVPTTADADRVAQIVWQSFHERFDYLEVTVHGSGPAVTQEYTFDQLQSTFGARNPAWNKTSVRSAYDAVGIEIVVGLAVLALIVLGIVLLATRGKRRRKREARAWPYGGPGGPYGGPGGPYGGPSGPYGPYGGPGPPPGPPYGGAPGSVAPAPPGGGHGAGGYPMWQPPAHPPRDPSDEPPPEQAS